MKKIFPAILMLLFLVSCSTTRDENFKRPMDLRGQAESTTNNRK